MSPLCSDLCWEVSCFVTWKREKISLYGTERLQSTRFIIIMWRVFGRDILHKLYRSFKPTGQDKFGSHIARQILVYMLKTEYKQLRCCTWRSSINVVLVWQLCSYFCKFYNFLHFYILIISVRANLIEIRMLVLRSFVVENRQYMALSCRKVYEIIFIRIILSLLKFIQCFVL